MCDGWNSQDSHFRLPLEMYNEMDRDEALSLWQECKELRETVVGQAESTFIMSSWVTYLLLTLTFREENVDIDFITPTDMNILFFISQYK